MAGLQSQNISLVSAHPHGMSDSTGLLTHSARSLDKNTCVFCRRRATPSFSDPHAPQFAFFSLVDCRHYACQPCALVQCDNDGRFIQCPQCHCVSRLAQTGRRRHASAPVINHSNRSQAALDTSLLAAARNPNHAVRDNTSIASDSLASVSRRRPSSAQPGGVRVHGTHHSAHRRAHSRRPAHNSDDVSEGEERVSIDDGISSIASRASLPSQSSRLSRPRATHTKSRDGSSRSRKHKKKESNDTPHDNNDTRRAKGIEEEGVNMASSHIDTPARKRLAAVHFAEGSTSPRSTSPLTQDAIAELRRGWRGGLGSSATSSHKHYHTMHNNSSAASSAMSTLTRASSMDRAEHRQHRNHALQSYSASGRADTEASRVVSLFTIPAHTTATNTTTTTTSAGSVQKIAHSAERHGRAVRGTHARSHSSSRRNVSPLHRLAVHALEETTKTARPERQQQQQQQRPTELAESTRQISDAEANQPLGEVRAPNAHASGLGAHNSPTEEEEEEAGAFGTNEPQTQNASNKGDENRNGAVETDTECAPGVAWGAGMVSGRGLDWGHALDSAESGAVSTESVVGAVYADVAHASPSEDHPLRRSAVPDNVAESDGTSRESNPSPVHAKGAESTGDAWGDSGAPAVPKEWGRVRDVTAHVTPGRGEWGNLPPRALFLPLDDAEQDELPHLVRAEAEERVALTASELHARRVILSPTGRDKNSSQCPRDTQPSNNGNSVRMCRRLNDILDDVEADRMALGTLELSPRTPTPPPAHSATTNAAEAAMRASSTSSSSLPMLPSAQTPSPPRLPRYSVDDERVSVTSDERSECTSARAKGGHAASSQTDEHRHTQRWQSPHEQQHRTSSSSSSSSFFAVSPRRHRTQTRSRRGSDAVSAAAEPVEATTRSTTQSRGDAGGRTRHDGDTRAANTSDEDAADARRVTDEHAAVQALIAQESVWRDTLESSATAVQQTLWGCAATAMVECVRDERAALAESAARCAVEHEANLQHRALLQHMVHLLQWQYAQQVHHMLPTAAVVSCLREEESARHAVRAREQSAWRHLWRQRRGGHESGGADRWWDAAAAAGRRRRVARWTEAAAPVPRRSRHTSPTPPPPNASPTQRGDRKDDDSATTTEATERGGGADVTDSPAPRWARVTRAETRLTAESSPHGVASNAVGTTGPMAAGVVPEPTRESVWAAAHGEGSVRRQSPLRARDESPHRHGAKDPAIAAHAGTTPVEKKGEMGGVPVEPNRVLDEPIRVPDESNRVPVEPNRVPDESNRVPDEPIRVLDEPNRVPDESNRVPVEPNRVPDESNRVPDEPIRVLDEPNRVPDEPIRVPVEPIRVLDEPIRVLDEPNRVPDEPIRVPDEPNRVPDESNRVPVEPNRVPDESNRVPVEPIRVLDEPNRVPDEPIRVPVEPIRVLDEPIRVLDEPNRVPDEPIRVPDESNRVPDEPIRVPDESNRVPDEPNRVPVELNRISDEPNRVPDESNRVPDEPNRVPVELNRISDEPNRVPDEPIRVPVEPIRVPDESNRVPVEPNRVPVELNRISDEPNRVPDESNRVPDEPNRVPVELNRISEQSNRVPDEPNRVPDEPNCISGEPNRVSVEEPRVGSMAAGAEKGPRRRGAGRPVYTVDLPRHRRRGVVVDWLSVRCGAERGDGRNGAARRKEEEREACPGADGAAACRGAPDPTARRHRVENGGGGANGPSRAVPRIEAFVWLGLSWMTLLLMAMMATLCWTRTTRRDEGAPRRRAAARHAVAHVRRDESVSARRASSASASGSADEGDARAPVVPAAVAAPDRMAAPTRPHFAAFFVSLTDSHGSLSAVKPKPPAPHNYLRVHRLAAGRRDVVPAAAAAAARATAAQRATTDQERSVVTPPHRRRGPRFSSAVKENRSDSARGPTRRRDGGFFVPLTSSSPSASSRHAAAASMAPLMGSAATRVTAMAPRGDMTSNMPCPARTRTRRAHDPDERPRLRPVSLNRVSNTRWTSVRDTTDTKSTNRVRRLSCVQTKNTRPADETRPGGNARQDTTNHHHNHNHNHNHNRDNRHSNRGDVAVEDAARRKGNVEVEEVEVEVEERAQEGVAESTLRGEVYRTAPHGIGEKHVDPRPTGGTTMSPYPVAMHVGSHGEDSKAVNGEDGRRSREPTQSRAATRRNTAYPDMVHTPIVPTHHEEVTQTRTVRRTHGTGVDKEHEEDVYRADTDPCDPSSSFYYVSSQSKQEEPPQHRRLGRTSTNDHAKGVPTGGGRTDEEGHATQRPCPRDVHSHHDSYQSGSYFAHYYGTRGSTLPQHGGRHAEAAAATAMATAATLSSVLHPGHGTVPTVEELDRRLRELRARDDRYFGAMPHLARTPSWVRGGERSSGGPYINRDENNYSPHQDTDDACHSNQGNYRHRHHPSSSDDAYYYRRRMHTNDENAEGTDEDDPPVPRTGWASMTPALTVQLSRKAPAAVGVGETGDGTRWVRQGGRTRSAARQFVSPPWRTDLNSGAPRPPWNSTRPRTKNAPLHASQLVV